MVRRMMLREAMMPSYRRSDDNVVVVGATTEDRLMYRLGAWAEAQILKQPTNVDDCKDMLGALMSESAAIALVTIMGRQLH